MLGSQMTRKLYLSMLLLTKIYQILYRWFDFFKFYLISDCIELKFLSACCLLLLVLRCACDIGVLAEGQRTSNNRQWAHIEQWKIMSFSRRNRKCDSREAACCCDPWEKLFSSPAEWGSKGDSCSLIRRGLLNIKLWLNPKGTF